MKRGLQKIFTLLMTLMLIFIFSTNVYANSKENEYFDGHIKIINAMKEEVTSCKKFGDVTADFLEEMIIHNQGAIYMSENILKYGSNKNVREIAKSVIRNQINTITEMSAILEVMEDNLKINKVKENEYLEKYDEIIKSMIADMESIKSTENIDNHYLELMNLYEKTNIKMAKNISKYTEDKAVKKLINKIEKNSSKQIEEIKQILS